MGDVSNEYLFDISSKYSWGKVTYYIMSVKPAKKYLFYFYYIGISSMQNILECATKVARTLKELEKSKELQI